MQNNFFEFQLISNFYGDTVTKRSKVPLINHIKEGLIVLDTIGASEEAKRAFCLHPMVQGDKELLENLSTLILYKINSQVLCLVMEYRNIANAYLSRHWSEDSQIILSPLKDVNDMLIADKVQNRKDFEIYNINTHENSKVLDSYFRKWCKALNVENEYPSLVEKIILLSK